MKELFDCVREKNLPALLESIEKLRQELNEEIRRNLQEIVMQN